MGLFDRFKTHNKQERAFFPYSTEGVIQTSFYSNETNPTVLACVNKVANTISELKLSLYIRRTGGGRSPAVFNPLFKVIESPSVEETPTLFYNTLVRHILLKGNAFVYLGRGSDGTIVTLSLVNPDNVIIERDSSYKKYYIIAGKKYTDYDVLHIPYLGQGYNGTKGKSPIDVVSDLITVDNQLLMYTKNYFNNSLGTRTAVELGESYKSASTKDKDYAALYAAITPIINKYMVGANNAGKMMISLPDSKLSKIEQPTNVEAELNSLIVMIERQIAQAFNVPWDLLSGENKYNTLEQRQQNFLSECIKPLGDHLCESWGKLLLPQDGPLYFSYDYKSLLATDTKSTIESLAKEISFGMISINEARAKLEMDSIGTVGDNYFIQASFYPLTQENIDAFFAASKVTLQQNAGSTHNPAGDDKG